MIDFDRKDLAVVEEIKDVIDHPNADRLDIVTIQDWQCVSAKGTFKAGDKCVYFVIDSILPLEIESKIFGADSKVRLKKARVRTIKLRGAISQGLAVPATEFGFHLYSVGKDVTKKLNIGKYVPTPKSDSALHVGSKPKSFENPNFNKMRKPVHLKKVGAFDEEVVITEKIHGTSFIAEWVKRPTDTFAQKLTTKFFGGYKFCYRSMNVQLQGQDGLIFNIMKKFGLKKDPDMLNTLYGRMCLKYGLRNKLDFGEGVTAEIYGPGIQKNYTYGCKDGEHQIAGFGFRVNGKDIPPLEAHMRLIAIGVTPVPVLYVGVPPEDMTTYTTGRSVLDPKTKVREGCVVNTVSGEKGWHGCALVKDINPKYLLDDRNTEFN